jgi:hypothetical protein
MGLEWNCSNTHMNLVSGAVANGRAKFEAVAATHQSVPPGGGSESKPLRFFSSSKSRGNSPLLPVKTPKVPSNANANTNAPATTTVNAIATAASSSTPQAKKKTVTSSSTQSGPTPEATGVKSHLDISPESSAKLFPKMKR